MKETNLTIILITCIAILFFCTNSFSQTTTTILYDVSSGLSTTKCNVFDPPLSVGGRVHTGVIGAATFSTANGLTLPTNYTASPQHVNRSDYKISYLFKAGYLYQIEITASGFASNSTNYPSLGVALFTNALNYTSISCIAGDIGGFPQIGSVMITPVNSIPTIYSPSSANFISPFDFDYLLIEATCRAAEDLSDLLYIQKVKIIETAPVSFTLPGSTVFACGSTAPQTFTVTNVYGTAGITDYTWNLGSAENNWLYNGSPAPQTISTGTVSSISLTPVCGQTQNDLSATVTANGQTYNTNVSTVTVTPPDANVVGSATICSGSSAYVISNLPCNSNVRWSVSPTGIALLTIANDSAVLTRTGSGVITLTADISSGCAPTTLTKKISIGTPTVTISVPGSICACTCCNYFTATDIPGVAYAWSISPTAGNSVSPMGSQAEVMITTAANLTVQAVSTCGTTSATKRLFLKPASQCNAGCSVAFAISPNPAQGVITIIAQDNQIHPAPKKPSGHKVLGIKSVRIYDLSGRLVKQRQNAGNDVQGLTIDVSAL